MDWMFMLIALLKVLVVLVVFVLMLGAVLTWVERRMSALIQDRLGPNRAQIGNVRAPLHPIADMFKAFTKEDFVPAGANRMLFFLAPAIALASTLACFAVIPFGPGEHFTIAPLDSGMLFIIAIGSFGIYGVALGGWASNNNFGLLGALRGAAQLVSYEVTMGLNLVGVFAVFGTMSLSQLVLGQGELLWGWLPKWGVVVQPVGFVLFLIASMAENKRAPFDLPEGESEIIGYFAEFSAMRFATFFLTEFAEIVLIAAIANSILWRMADSWLDPRASLAALSPLRRLASSCSK